jgi:hypothetical protein
LSQKYYKVKLSESRRGARTSRRAKEESSLCLGA